MALYRFYFLNDLDHFGAVKVVDCVSDAEALIFAGRTLGDWPGIEVWETSRLIGSVHQPTLELELWNEPSAAEFLAAVVQPT